MSNSDGHCRPIRTAEELGRLLKRELHDGDLGRVVAPFVSKTTPAFLIRYPFGGEVVRGGRLQVQCEPTNLCEGCRELDGLIDDLSLTIPLSLVIKGAVEVFVPLRGSTEEHSPSRPMRLLNPGEFFGVFETLDAQFLDTADMPPWEVAAGARSIAVLTSQMSDRTQSELMRSLITRGSRGSDVSTALKAMQRDGWELVRHLVNGYQPTPQREWMAEILVFTGATARSLRSTRQGGPALLRFAEIGWTQSRHLRGGLIQEERLFQLQYFKSTTIPKDDRVTLLGVLRQLVATARGEVPAFAPAMSEATLPIGLFYERFRDISGARPALVIAPYHLRNAGDRAFVSIKFNCLPAQSSERPRTWRQYCEHIEYALKEIPGHPLDPELTRFLDAGEGLEALATAAKMSPANGKHRIPQDHPFFTGCLQLVRG